MLVPRSVPPANVIVWLKLPPNAQFRHALFTASQEVDHDSLELVGTEGLYATSGPRRFHIVTAVSAAGKVIAIAESNGPKPEKKAGKKHEK